MTPEEKRIAIKRELVRRRLGELQESAAVSTAPPSVRSPIDAAASEVEAPLMDRLFPDGGRDALRVGGATVGSALGAPLGPGGVVAGGVLGDMAGSFAASTIQGESLSESVPKALESGKDEGAYSMAFMSAGPLLKSIREYIPKALGVDRKAAQESMAQGIPLGIADVGGGFAKGYRRVLGKFPFFSGPFKNAAVDQKNAVIGRRAEILDAIAPSVSSSELGVDIFKAAKNANKEFIDSAVNLYQVADDLAAPAGAIVKTNPIKITAQNIISESSRPVLKNGKTLPKPVRSELDDYLESIAELDDRITVKELRTIQKDINKFWDMVSSRGISGEDLKELKKATEDSLLLLDLDGVKNADQISKAYKTANSFWHEGMKVFETSTAKKAGRADLNIFKPGAFKAGSLNDDELANVMINLKSARSIKDLRSLVGDEVVNKAARNKVDQALSLATKEVEGGFKIDSSVIRKSLGLDNTSKNSVEAFTEIMRTTGVSAKEFNQFLNVLDRVGEIVIPSQFIARRAALGGLRSAIRGASPLALLGSSGTTSAVTGNPSPLLVVAGALAIRKGSKLLSSPKTLKSVVAMMDDNLPRDQKLALAGRLVNLMFNDESDNGIQ